MDERILPVGPASDNSFVKVTIEAEVYYKGNRHPTRRLLQADANPAATRGQKHAMSVGYGVQHRAALDTCVIDPKQESGMMKMTVTYAKNKNMPKAGDMPTFVSELSMQIDEYHKVRGSVSIEKVERCTKRCQMIYSKSGEKAARRRAEDGEATSLNVYLKFNSVQTNKAGYIMNEFQNNLNNPSSDMHKQVNVFTTATVTKLEVDGCNGKTLGATKTAAAKTDAKDLFDMVKEESSAVRATSFFAVALLYLLW